MSLGNHMNSVAQPDERVHTGKFSKLIYSYLFTGTAIADFLNKYK